MANSWYDDAPPVIQVVWDEYQKATRKFGSFHGRHEGYAVILEELDELWDEVKADAGNGPVSAEAVQVAAMGLRFLTDCCDISDQPKSG
jgi:hypothetical protein